MTVSAWEETEPICTNLHIGLARDKCNTTESGAASEPATGDAVFMALNSSQ